MNTIHIQKKIDSETLHIPELKPLIGKTVEIIVYEKDPSSPATEEEWIRFFEEVGPIDIDPEIHKQYREFDKKHNVPPEL